jgi:hypothetical protein
MALWCLAMSEDTETLEFATKIPCRCTFFRTASRFAPASPPSSANSVARSIRLEQDRVVHPASAREGVPRRGGLKLQKVGSLAERPENSSWLAAEVAAPPLVS